MTNKDILPYLDEAIGTFRNDPPDSPFQRGYLAALKEVKRELTEPEPPLIANHILIYALPKQFRIVGPFKTQADLDQWGRKWQEVNGDDPRWQQIALPYPAVSMVIPIQVPAIAP